jgi:antitoxin YefM
MANTTSYTELRDHLSTRLDQVSDDREVLIVQRRGGRIRDGRNTQRRGGRDVAIIAADELVSLLETAHLLRSPLNSDRLMQALDHALKGDGAPARVLTPARAPELAPEPALAELRRSVNLPVELKSKRTTSQAGLAAC